MPLSNKSSNGKLPLDTHLTDKRPTDRSATPPRLFSNRNYLWWLATDSSSAFGTALHSFSVPLLALYITGSPAQAGLIAGIGQLGRVLTTIPGGVIADRYNRRTLMVLGGVMGLVIGSALTAFQLSGLLGFWLLTALNLLMSMRAGLFGSASNAALKQVVNAEQVGPAMAANQGRDAVIALSGGPVGGVLMSLGRAVPFAATALSHAVAIAAAFMIRVDMSPADRAEQLATSGPPATSKGPVGSFMEEAVLGIKWLLGRTELRGIMILSTIINLGINAALTSVIFGLQQRGESPAAIGLVSAGIGAGMLVGSLVAAPLVKRVGAGTIVISGLFFMSAALAVLPFVSSLPTVMVVQSIAIFSAPAINAALLGYFMVAVPTELLGRATSALDLMSMGAMPLAPLVAGFGYALLGWSGILLVCAGICALAAVLAWANRGLRALPSSEHWAQHAAANSPSTT